MKTKLLSLLALMLMPVTTWANAELMQIVALSWDESAQKLTPFSFGSGTAIAKDLVITNKHVVKVGTQTADFVLLCPGQTQESRAVECNVAAGVSALHPRMDLALIRTLNSRDFLLSVRTSTAIRRPGDVVRVVGFPVPDDSNIENFGSTRTLEAFEAWQENPEQGLDFKGDSPTTTRGNVLARGVLESTNENYTLTDARVNFGNSGGAAFDQFGEYIGIPTLKDSLGRSYILEYEQMHDWVTTRSDRPPRIEQAAYDYYKGLVQGAVTSVRTNNATTSTSSTSSPMSSRMRYFQMLRERQASTASTEAQSRTSERRTTSRRYSSPYSGYRTYQAR